VDLGRNPLFCPIIFWPAGTGLALHTLALPYGVLSIPFQLALGDLRGIAVAGNVVALSSFTLSAVGAFMLANYLLDDRRAAFVAGVVFAFFPFRFVEMQLLHVSCIEWIPFTVLFLLKALREGRTRHGVGLGVCFALQAYISLEHALYLALLLALIAAHHIVRRRSRSRLGKRELRAGLVAVAIFFALTAPLATGIDSGRARTDLEEKREDFLKTAVRDSPPWFAFLRPNPLSPLWSSMGHGRGQRLAFWDVSLGSVAVVLVVIALMSAARREAGFWALAAGGLLLLTLGPYLKLGYRQTTSVPLPFLLLWRYVPLFNMARAPSRILLVAMLPISVLNGFGARAAMRALSGASARRLAMAALLSLAVLGEALIVPLPRGRFPVPSFCRVLAERADSDGVIDFHPLRKVALFAQAVHHKPLVLWENEAIAPRGRADGVRIARELVTVRSLYRPGAYRTLPSDVRGSIVLRARQELWRHGIGYVVLHKRFHTIRAPGETKEHETPPAVIAAQRRVLLDFGLRELWEDEASILFRSPQS